MVPFTGKPVRARAVVVSSQLPTIAVGDARRHLASACPVRRVAGPDRIGIEDMGSVPDAAGANHRPGTRDSAAIFRRHRRCRSSRCRSRATTCSSPSRAGCLDICAPLEIYHERTFILVKMGEFCKLEIEYLAKRFFKC